VCIKRHYYINEQEKTTLIAWRMRKEVRMEMNILSRIAEREALLDDITMESKELQRRYLHDHDIKIDVGLVLPLLQRLDKVRLATVFAVEVRGEEGRE